MPILCPQCKTPFEKYGKLYFCPKCKIFFDRKLFVSKFNKLLTHTVNSVQAVARDKNNKPMAFFTMSRKNGIETKSIPYKKNPDKIIIFKENKPFHALTVFTYRDNTNLLFFSIDGICIYFQSDLSMEIFNKIEEYMSKQVIKS